jgi:tetratricopeptide (TPR) repeat protein
MEALYNMAFIPLMAQGDTDKAIALFEEVLAIARELEDRQTIGRATGARGYALFIKSDFAAAIAPLEESIAVSREIGDRFHVADATQSLGQVHRLMGDLAGARRYYDEALDLYLQSGNLPMTVTLTYMFSATSSAEGDHEKAAKLWGAAEAAREKVGAGAPPPLMRLGDPVADAEKALGPEAVQELLAAGRAMDLEKALAYARES